MKRRQLIVILVGIFLVVAVAIVIAVVLVLKDDDDDKSEAKTAPPTPAFLTAETQCGKVTGKRISVVEHNKTVYQFRNIPYAIPPVKERRWKPPLGLVKDKTCWSGTLNYTNTTIMCPQKHQGVRPLQGQEDCLYLDVRSPNFHYQTRKLPVLVWIHGGAMLYNHKEKQGYYTDAETTAALDVVTVNVGYRLNVFGFLSLKELWIDSGPDESYANYGILDIIQSLQWVKDNIKQFGGDPDNVIVFGQSGGATACYSLLASPKAKGLFHKIIASSGIPNQRITYAQASGLYRPFIKNVNCTRDNASEVRRCLEDLPVETAVTLSPWFVSLIPNVPPLLVNLISYRVYFPYNRPYQGYPIEVLDPLVIPKSPSDVNTTMSNIPIEIISSSVAQEVPYLPPVNITNMLSLRLELEPKLATFNASYDQLLQTYSEANLTFKPNDYTAKYLYLTMTTDAIQTCMFTELLKQYNGTVDMKPAQLLVAQPPEPGNGDKNFAYHGWDTKALFGFKDKKGFVPRENDLILKENLRSIYKDFCHNQFQGFGHTNVLWNNTVTMKPYHEDQCKYWKKYGFMKFSGGNLGT